MGLVSTSIQAAALGGFVAFSTAACGGKSLTDDSGGMLSAAGSTSVGGAASGGGTNSSSGAPGVAGDAGVAGSSCVTPAECGGAITGTWSVTSSCLSVSGSLDLSAVGIGCAAAAITSGYRQVSGSWTAHADGTYSDATTTTGMDHLELSPACLNISGAQVSCDGMGPLFTVFGYSSASCVKVPEGGCACSALVKQAGGLGNVSVDPSTYGSFSALNNVVTLDSGWSYPYCAIGHVLTLAPNTANPTLTGSIGLERVGK